MSFNSHKSHGHPVRSVPHALKPSPLAMKKLGTPLITQAVESPVQHLHGFCSGGGDGFPQLSHFQLCYCHLFIYLFSPSSFSFSFSFGTWVVTITPHFLGRHLSPTLLCPAVVSPPFLSSPRNPANTKATGVANISWEFEEDAGGGMHEEGGTGHEVCSNLTFDCTGNCRWGHVSL